MGGSVGEGYLKNKVFVTGMGVVNSIANSISEFEKSLQQGMQGITCGSGNSDYESINVKAEVNNFNLKSLIDNNFYSSLIPKDTVLMIKKCVRRTSFSMQTAISAVLEAFIEAQLFQKTINKDRIGIVVAGSNLTNKVRETYNSSYKIDPSYLSPRYAIQFMDTDYVGTLSEIFNIKGEGFTVGGASASGNVGIIKAYQLIKLGIVDVCVVVGALTELTDMELSGFYNIGALGGRKYCNEPNKACRPFDKNHEGFIYGQGCGCLILESAKSIKDREVNPISELLGGSIKLDGNSSSNPSEVGEINVMNSALKESNISIKDVDYINAHGTSSPLGDETELKAIKSVFGEEIKRIWINSTKGLTGHCLFSAGVIEAISSILQMRGNFIHPNVNLEEPISTEYLFAKESSTPAKIKIAMSNSFGFGGINTSIILRNI